MGTENESEHDHIRAEGYVFKETVNPEIVVLRWLTITRDKFYTYHDEQKEVSTRKVWTLDKYCTIEPKSLENLALIKKHVRPRGTLTITAMITGTNEVKQLYAFTITWPTTWAAKGFFNLSLGFETKTVAQQFYNAFLDQLALLKMRASSSRSEGHHSKKPSLSEDTKAFGSPVPVEPAPRRVEATSTEKKVVFDPEIRQDRKPAPNADPFGEDSDNDDIAVFQTNEYCYTAQQGRWIPYRHTNGVAIYYHSDTASAGGVGGEYMASSVVRGSPNDCLRVLMDPSSHTTILGPASVIEVLEAQAEKQVLRIVVEAYGFASKLCAPREAVVERILKKDDSGIDVIMFSSIDRSIAEDRTRAKEPGHRTPVRCTVRGGYTISPLESYEGKHSPECLVTAILRVDLRGALGDGAWFRPLADAAGWVDAFVDRMLMAVILVKDEVEQKRFLVRPFSILDSRDVDGEERLPPGAVRSTSHIIHENRPGSPHRLSKMSTRKHRDTALSALVSGAVAPSAAATAGSGEPPFATPPAPGAGLGMVEALAAAGELEDMVEVPDDGGVTDPEQLATLPKRFWEELHVPGTDRPFKVRGPNYLVDKVKVEAGHPEFVLSAVDLVIIDDVVPHIARYLPSVRRNRAAFMFVVNLIIPGTPLLSLVLTWANENHPDVLGAAPSNPDDPDCDWQPFDWALHKFLTGSDDTRNSQFKLIPHIAEGSWVIKQSVGTVPVILGRKLKTTYHRTRRYVEVDVDVSSTSSAAYITGMVRGTTKSLVIDMTFLLEATAPHELPESLIGTLRLNHLDLAHATRIDTSTEIPMVAPLRPRGGPHSRKGSAAL